MKKIKQFHLLMLTCALCMPSMFCTAQTVSVDFDSKVIYTDSLNMPESTIAKYIVSILPELLERPGDFSLNDYDVKVEDMPVGDAIDAVLTQIRFCDIEKIEISESPLSSFQHESKSGSINIILKKRDTEQKHYWGSASLDYTTPMDICPSASFGYRKDKFMIRALLVGEYYKADYDTDNVDYDGKGNQLSTITQNSSEKFWTNMGTLFMNYNATPKDEFLLRASIRRSIEKMDVTSSDPYHLPSNKEENRTNLRAYLKYKHIFSPNSQLEFESQYNHHPERDDVSEGAGTIYRDDKDNDISGQLKLKLSLLPADSKYKSFLCVGSNGFASFGNNYTGHLQTAVERHSSSDKVRSRGLTPFIESENTLGQFKVKLVANLQYYHYDFRREGSERMHRDNTDLAGKLMVEWHFKPGQMFRLIGDHQNSRPSEMMIYPYLVEDAATQAHLIGNLDLESTRSNSCTLDYFYSKYWGDHSLTMNVSGSYNHISDIIEGTTKSDDKGEVYNTYCNVGKNNMLVGMIMAMYKYKMLSLTLTADYYNNFKKLDSGDDHYRYFDISLMPTFKTRTNWMASMRIKYFSPVDTKRIHRGACAGISCQIGKTWGAFNVHAFGNVSLLGRTTDTTYGADGLYSETISNVIKNSCGAGVRYSF